jgi:hypothetical protein
MLKLNCQLVYISRFGMFYQEKSGNPVWVHTLLNLFEVRKLKPPMYFDFTHSVIGLRMYLHISNTEK